jgi:biotin carboxyl carrier protein
MGLAGKLHKYRIKVNGTNYAVTADSANEGKLRVTLDGETLEVDSLSSGNISAWLIGSGDESIRAYARMQDSGSVNVWLRGLAFIASVQPVTGTVVPNEKSAREPFSGKIQALMPGRITGILVKEGEVVEAGTPLLILEAMKMQNEITSPAAGRIAGIQVREGESVKRGSILLVLDNSNATKPVL